MIDKNWRRKLGTKTKIWLTYSLYHQACYSLTDHVMAMLSYSYFYAAIHLVPMLLIVR